MMIGAIPEARGVRFTVWAESRRSVEVVLEGGAKPGGQPRAFALERGSGGYFSALVGEAGPGTRYRYRLDGDALLPDPASRRQPDGPHGLSEVVDAARFPWEDHDWRGLQMPGQVLYELHVGTFTPEGTFAAAARDLPRLKDLGVTAVELMPVAEFPGEFGWGYDGVALYAPYHVYGSPDELRRLVDHAHSLGLGVILDVVYNHLGPDGAYHKEFSRRYYDEARPKTEWGDALNFDGEGSEGAREYFLQNAEYWVRDFHLDGLRLDAVHAIVDESGDHFLAALSRRARAAAGDRSIILVAEDEFQDTARVRHLAEGGQGLDAQWNDDFHHAAAVALTGRSEAYYSDFGGTPQELISAIKWGFLFQGQYFSWQGKRRGTPTFGLPAHAFVSYLQNHDQVSNSARGDRLNRLTSPGQWKAMTAAWLLAPQTPMLFQGQEYAASNPFLFFADHVDELAALVRKGRVEFLSQFRSIAARPEVVAHLPHPGLPTTFEASRLDPAERERNRPMVALHRDLIRLRRDDPFFSTQRADLIHGAVIGPDAFVLRYFDAAGTHDCRLLVVNLGRDLFPDPASEPLMAPPPGKRWDLVWYSEHPDYGGCGAPPYEAADRWRVPGHAALVLGPVDEG
jgi:maltooligosyltrehalose trehalohydrolase